MTTLQARQLAYARGDRHLFSDIDFEIGAGEALWLTGRNGSGKTSLLRLLCGLTMPDAGEVRWDGRSIQRLREDFYQHLIYCGHASAVKEDLAAWENLAIWASLSGKQGGKQEIWNVLEQAGVASIAHLPGRALSQGERKRVALARLFIHPIPRLWILDEPFVALDGHAVRALCETLNHHLKQGGIVIYTTHQKQDLNAGRTHVVDLDRGT